MNTNLLAPLFADLRNNGFFCGPEEIVTLKRAFSTTALIQRPDNIELKDRLFDILACVVNKDPKQQDLLQAIFDDWWSMTVDVISKLDPEPSIVDAENPPDKHANKSEDHGSAPHKQKPKPLSSVNLSRQLQILFLKALVVATLITLSIPLIRNLNAPPPIDPSPIQPHLPTPEPRPKAKISQLAYWSLESLDDPTNLGLANPALYSAIALFLFAIATCAAGFSLSRHFLARCRFPKPIDAPKASGNWTQTQQEHGLKVLSDHTLRDITWNVDKFVTENLTQDIDSHKTVKSSAQAGGIPTLHYLNAKERRQVWIWRDAWLANEAASRMTCEILADLELAGLPAKEGVFHRFPEIIHWTNGPSSSPLREGLPKQAIVSILTDGQGIDMAWRSKWQKQRLIPLLQYFSDWPHLVFVDPSDGEFGLAKKLETFDIETIRLRDWEAFLTKRKPEPRASTQNTTALTGEHKAWAAALAISPEAVPHSTAQELRQKLRIDCHGLDFQELIAFNSQDHETIYWSPRQRAELLQWLVRCLPQPNTISKSSLLYSSLRFWEQHYKNQRNKKLSDEMAGLDTWRGTAAEQQQLLHEMMIKIWHEPHITAGTLYRLFRGPLKDQVTTALRSFIPTDCIPADGPNLENLIHLPWAWREQRPETKMLFTRMGFPSIHFSQLDSQLARTRRLKKVKAPKSLLFSIALCFGLSLIALFFGVSTLMSGPIPQMTIKTQESIPKQLCNEQLTLRRGPKQWGRYRILIGNRRTGQFKQLSAPAGSNLRVHVRWIQKDIENPRVTQGNCQLWCAGTLPDAIQNRTQIQRQSLIVLAVDPKKDNTAKDFAKLLLDRGSADRVLIGLNWHESIAELISFPREFTHLDQLTVFQNETNYQRSLQILKPLFQGSLGFYKLNAPCRKLSDILKRVSNESTFTPTNLWDSNIKQLNSPARSMALQTAPKIYHTLNSSKGDFRSFLRVPAGLYKAPNPSTDWIVIEEFYVSMNPVKPETIKGYLKGDGKSAWIKAAEKFCAAKGYTLPTEKQWNYARQRGVFVSENADPRTYPNSKATPITDIASRGFFCVSKGGFWSGD